MVEINAERESMLEKLHPVFREIDHAVVKYIELTHKPGLFTRYWRRQGESLIHWDVIPGLWFRLFTQAVKLTNLKNLSPRQENCFKEQTRRLSS
jgi:hypothetical protein